jgi:hypothetical protein
MSMIRCSKCSLVVDSDDDPEMFVEVITFGDDGATETVVMCETCREKEEAEALEEMGVDL